MTSWGGARSNKFYKGNKNDTAWNNDLLWIMHCAKEAKGLKKRPPRRMHDSDLGNIGGRKTTPALSTRDIPRSSRSRMSNRSARSTGRVYDADKIQKEIERMVKQENSRRAAFDAELKALDEQLKAAKAKEIAALQRQLQTLEEEEGS